jgi:hypothetical protein
VDPSARADRACILFDSHGPGIPSRASLEARLTDFGVVPRLSANINTVLVFFSSKPSNGGVKGQVSYV